MRTDSFVASAVSRGADQMFDSFGELRKQAVSQRKRCREELAEADKAFFTNDGLLSFGNLEVKPTGYLWQQIARSVGLRRTDIARILEKGGHEIQKHLSAVLNSLWPRETGNKINLLVEDKGSDGLYGRCHTSDTYVRIYDAQVCDVIEKWLAPAKDGGKWMEARPTINKKGEDAKPAIMRGEQDMYTFFYTGRDNGSLDDFGGLRKGVVIYNSEVGVRTLGMATFLFRELCGNYLVWGMEDFSEVEHRHVGKVGDFFKDTIEKNLRELGGTIEDAWWDELEVAANTEFAKDPEKAQDRLVRQFEMPKAKAHEVVRLALDEQAGTGDLSIWGITNGITALGRDPAYANDMFAAGAEARSVMQLAMAK